jgi:hypothetical protein
MNNKEFKLKTLLTLLIVLFAFFPSFSNAKETGIEEISPSIMQKVKTAIHECFKTNLEENFQIKALTGGYSATSIL